MAYKIRHLPSALRDSDRIAAYLAQTLGLLDIASRFKYGLRECYGRLRKYPLMYSPPLNETLAARGFRCAQVMRYMVFYTVDKEEKVVWIHRIMHETMDYTQQEMS